MHIVCDESVEQDATDLRNELTVKGVEALLLEQINDDDDDEGIQMTKPLGSMLYIASEAAVSSACWPTIERRLLGGLRSQRHLLVIVVGSGTISELMHRFCSKHSELVRLFDHECLVYRTKNNMYEHETMLREIIRRLRRHVTLHRIYTDGTLTVHLLASNRLVTGL